MSGTATLLSKYGNAVVDSSTFEAKIQPGIIKAFESLNIKEKVFENFSFLGWGEYWLKNVPFSVGDNFRGWFFF